MCARGIVTQSVILACGSHVVSLARASSLRAFNLTGKPVA